MNEKNRWISHDLWHCTRRLAGTFPASMEKCWYAGCIERCGGRPSLDHRPLKDPVKVADPVVKEAPREIRIKPLPKKGRGNIRVVCHHCKTPIYRKPSDVSRNKSGVFFCTPEHSAVHRKEQREIEMVKVALNVCAWKECSETARTKSKYCSRDCSNKNARYRHKKRKVA